MPYDNKQIAKELDATAMGQSYYGNAFYVARDLQLTIDTDRSMLTRWLNGGQTSQDFHALQDFAILTRFNGTMPL